MRWQNAMTRAAASAAAIAVVLVGGAALAADIMLNAVNYVDKPVGKTVSVEIFNDSPINIALKEQFEAELRNQGYTVQDGAQFIVSIDTRDTSGSWTGGGSTSIIDIANQDNHTGTDSPKVRMRIFDTQRGGLLNKKQETGVTEVSPSEFRIDATVEDRSNGRRMWEGWTIMGIEGGDNTIAQHAMVAPLVSNIGKTVRDAVIPLR